MTIKTNGKNTYLITPMDAFEVLGVKTNKSILIDEKLNFIIEQTTEMMFGEEWIDGELDGRKFRRLKKNIIKELGDLLLEEYRTTNKVHEVLSKKFINTSAVSGVFKNALANDMNLILFGKGGFGKSEMCNELFGGAELKDRVFIKSLSEATAVEDLFGGINVKKMTESGEIEYICENSFANKEIVIFEEIFDANPQVLAALKDALTSKEIRNGNQRFPMKTKIIIGLTNKTYEDVIQDDSTEALTQRFPVAFKLQYAMTKLNTASLILNRYSDFEVNKLAAIVETINEMADLTPRKILEMAKYIKNLEIVKNKAYPEKITNNMMGPVINYLKAKSSIDVTKVLFNEVAVTKKAVKEEGINDYDSFIDLLHGANIIKGIDFGAEKTAKSLSSELGELITLIQNKNK